MSANGKKGSSTRRLTEEHRFIADLVAVLQTIEEVCKTEPAVPIGPMALAFDGDIDRIAAIIAALRHHSWIEAVGDERDGMVRISELGRLRCRTVEEALAAAKRKRIADRQDGNDFSVVDEGR